MALSLLVLTTHRALQGSVSAMEDTMAQETTMVAHGCHCPREQVAQIQ